MNPLAIEIIGWAGNIVFITAYGLVSNGRISGEGLLYNVMILAQSMLFALYTANKDSIPVVLVEIVTIALALHAIYRGKTTR